MLQAVLAAVCAMFAVLWFRALTRVRRNVCERSMVAQHVAQVLGSLGPNRVRHVTHRLVRFQASVRRQQAAVLRRRLQAMEAYEASGPLRNQCCGC